MNVYDKVSYYYSLWTNIPEHVYINECNKEEVFIKLNNSITCCLIYYGDYHVFIDLIQSHPVLHIMLITTCSLT